MNQESFIEPEDQETGIFYDHRGKAFPYLNETFLTLAEVWNHARPDMEFLEAFGYNFIHSMLPNVIAEVHVNGEWWEFDVQDFCVIEAMCPIKLTNVKSPDQDQMMINFLAWSKEEHNIRGQR